MERTATLERETKETSIKVVLDVDGKGHANIKTGVGFFDHMLTLLAYHGLFDLDVEAKGDLHVDAHHTVEDVGIVLGDCLDKALGKREGIKRYGSSTIPMDEALSTVTVDLGGRPFLVFNCQFPTSKIGDFDAELIEEFLRALANRLKANIHVNLLYGRNAHHIAESVFKALGRALDEATTIDKRISGQLTTKGVL